jgi:hypothetical protein
MVNSGNSNRLSRCLLFFGTAAQGPLTIRNHAYNVIRIDINGRVTPSASRQSFSRYCAGIGIMLLLRLAMIQIEPVMTRKTINTPNARARILFVLSGALPIWRKKTR